MKQQIIPVILAGGSGTRLWPLSRKQYPKQFLKIDSDLSMLQQSAKRVEHLGAPIVICSESHRFLVASQFEELEMQLDSILLEPCSRDTAPALTSAALKALKDVNGDPILVVTPSDQDIDDTDAFKQCLDKAVARATDGEMVVFGVTPEGPETGFGYIKAIADGDLYKVDKFVEKPDLITAQSYVDSGDYFWNSGILVCRANRFLAAIKQFHPQMLDNCRRSLKSAVYDTDFIRLREVDFAKCEAISIDYAVLEKTSDLSLIPLPVNWSDMGSWQALWEKAERDEKGNASFGDTLLQDCQGSLVYSDSRLVTALGVKDLVIVDTKDALFVAEKGQAQNVKELVATLEKRGRSEFSDNREVHRPWGCFDSIEQGKNYQVKHLTVKPGEQLSLQMHYHRSEHWIVVSGSALVQCGDEKKMVVENESVYIAKGTSHSLENPGKIPLHVIEVQTGDYLGEDDIVRFLDKYNRLQDNVS